MVSSWLITGGCGFIGLSLIRKILLFNPNANIRVMDNLSVGNKEDLAEICDYKEINLKNIANHPLGVELVIGDIRCNNSCYAVAIGIDTVVHLAANTGVPNSVSEPRLDMECNVIGVFNMLEAAREQRVKRFVFASSGAPAGTVEPPIHEELPPHPISPYGASKLAGEGYCSAYHKSYGVETVALRFGNVYGPASKHKTSVVAKFIRLAMTGEQVEVYGDGSQTRDFIYIDDLIEAILRASTVENVGGETFQIATSKETTINELLKVLSQALETKNIKLNVKYSSKRLGDVLRNFSDTTKAKRYLGWKAGTTLESGVKQTVNWFYDNKA